MVLKKGRVDTSVHNRPGISGMIYEKRYSSNKFSQKVAFVRSNPSRGRT